MKIVTVLGARPQFIKAAAVSRVIKNRHEEIIIHTGQHYDENMSDIFFNDLEIPPPKYNLNVGSMSHGKQTGKMIIEIENILLSEKPDIVLLYGDTNSTLAGAIAASKINMAIAHVEGGVRNKDLTIPEEINRILTDNVSNLIFCPNNEAMEELKKENLSDRAINTGDVMLDALLFSHKKKRTTSSKDHILLTLHRPTNTDSKKRLYNILSAINSINTKVIFPVHPRTHAYLKKHNINTNQFINIEFIEPVNYFKMIELIDNSIYVITDSGGLQKEATFIGKKVIKVFSHTPWRELEKHQWIKVIENPQTDNFSEAIHDFLSKEPTIDPKSIFGNGKASYKIVQELEKYLS